jgi:hypothetical protein
MNLSNMGFVQQSATSMRNVIALSLLILSLTACSSSGNDGIDVSANKNIHDAIEAATGPLEDLNLRRTEIPPLLLKAEMNPYGRPAKLKCDGIKSEVAELDKILGPDVQPNLTLASADSGLIDNISSLSDVEMPTQQEAVDGMGELAHDSIMGFIRSQTSFIPLRSIVRKITGAESHQRHLEEAYQAGKLRRAYLKGLAQERFGPQCLAKPIMVQATPVAVEAKADITPTTPTGIAH